MKAVGLSGLIKSILGILTNETFLIKITNDEVKSPVYCRIPSTDINTYEQIFIDEEYHIKFRNEPKVIIDAGANIGLASIYFASKYPNSKIISIEPEQNNFQMLEQNAAHYDNIFPVRAALWPNLDKINVIDNGWGNWGFTTNITKEKKLHQINTITVEKIIEKFDLEQIDLFKIDIEGAEMELFSRKPNWLSKVKAIVIELHENLKPGCTEIFNIATSNFTNRTTIGENILITKQ